MRNADCYRLAKDLLPQLPKFVTNKKSEIFIAPIGHVLRGFTFESSAYTKEDFYFWWFFMPICRPIGHLTLNYGGRLNVPGGYSGWRTDMPELPDKMLAAMKPVALPLLQSINSIQDVIEAIYAHRGTREVDDINVQDDIACLQILDGRTDEAGIMLDSIIAHEHGTDRRQWVLNIVERTKQLKTKLQKDPKLSMTQVESWQDQTFRALQLERWRYSSS